MSWLKSIGQKIAGGARVVSGLPLGPVVSVAGALLKQPKVTALSDEADAVRRLAALVVQIEVAGAAAGLTGEQKLAAITPLASQILAEATGLAQHPIADPAKFTAGVQKVVSGLVDMHNAVSELDVA